MALITVGDAAKKCGVSRQTIINWGDKGLIDIKRFCHKRDGSWDYVFKEQIDEICQTSIDIEKTKKKLKESHDELRKDEKELLSKVKDTKDALRIIRCVGNGDTLRQVVLSIVELMYEIGCINERENKITRLAIQGWDIGQIGEELGITRTRVLQLIARASRKIKASTDIIETRRRYDKLLEEHNNLLCAFKALQEENSSLRERLHLIGDEKNARTIEEMKPSLIEMDEKCKLLATPFRKRGFGGGYENTFNLSVRTLNCLRSIDVKKVEELVKYDRTKLLKTRNFGRKSLMEIEDFLEENNLSLGMDIDKFYLERARMYFNINTEEMNQLR